jgi:transposase, IS6 family
VVQGQAFKGRQFAAEVILWAVRWYLMFPISYRDLALMLQDRGVAVDHTTIFRWIQAYFDKVTLPATFFLVRRAALRCER